ncbi:MAG: T9SS C-terminal target domain-containing protein [Crocinitomicaceae bacterium]|nr:T9SS C-terminal target domain-containing protein [Crocinitomicaceae bacterium]
MKKKNIYLASFVLSLGINLHAQDAFWTPTTYKGAFPVTDNTAASDWTSGWSNFDAENTDYPATITTVSTDITTSTIWSGVILLQNKIYVRNSATLTIAPGTIIRGDKPTQGSLIVTRGAKLNAIGTLANPIIFTSNEGIGNRNEGDWGGIVLLGLARNNQPGGVANIEGIVPTTDTQYGGSFDNDNSGTIKYVRIEFAGIALEPNKEINGLTCGSVGSATTIDFVQVSHSGDDSFEWFGGTVNCKHLIAYRGLDDDFDTDFGFRGKIQFALAIRDKDVSDAIGDSNSFESDNDAAGSAGQPKTAAIFSNVTLVGPKGNGSIVLPVGEKFEKAFRLRRNTAVSCFNSLVVGWEKGLSIEGTPVVNNVNGDTLLFSNNVLTGFTNNTNTIYNAGTSGGAASTSSFYTSFWGADGNDSTQSIAQVSWVNLFTPLGTTPDARLSSGSSAASGAAFIHPKFFSVAAPVVSTNSYTYCQGETATILSATSSNGNSLKWYDLPTGGTPLASAPVPSTSTAGVYSYYVSQANSNNDESPRVAITVTINALPSTPIISASGPTSFCTGGSVDLASSSTTGNVWTSATIFATTPTITVTSSGTYSVTVTDTNGCSSTSTPTPVNVSSAPIPTVSASSTQACSGELVTLTSSTADAYLWSNGDTTQAIQVTASGNFSVITTNSNACDGVGNSVPTTVTFTTSPSAAASFSTNGNVVTFTNTSTGASSYSWDFSDFTNSSATSPSHAFISNGSYPVILTAINGACTDTLLLTVNITVGIEELMGLNNITIYPNPANESLFVAFENQSGSAFKLLVSDRVGRIIQTIDVQDEDQNFVTMNVSSLANGMYSILFVGQNSSFTKSFIVAK